LGFAAFHGHHQTFLTFTGFYLIPSSLTFYRFFFLLRKKNLGELSPRAIQGRTRPQDIENVLYFIASIYFQVLVFDFQPKDPEDIYVALGVLSGRAVPGEIWTLFITCEHSDWIFCP